MLKNLARSSASTVPRTQKPIALVRRRKFPGDLIEPHGGFFRNQLRPPFSAGRPGESIKLSTRQRAPRGRVRTFPALNCPFFASASVFPSVGVRASDSALHFYLFMRHCTCGGNLFGSSLPSVRQSCVFAYYDQS